MKQKHRLFITHDEAYGFLAVSVDTPRFCVSAQTREDVRAKAIRALEFYSEHEADFVPVERNNTPANNNTYEEESVSA